MNLAVWDLDIKGNFEVDFISLKVLGLPRWKVCNNTIHLLIRIPNFSPSLSIQLVHDIVPKNILESFLNFNVFEY